MSKKLIYLDNAATTPVDPRVLKAMLPFLKDEFGNASSLHFAGIGAMAAVDEARAQIARFLGSKPEEVYFTSGATESDNLAILGLLGAIRKAAKSREMHVITTQIEHDAVLEPCRYLARQGAKLTYLPVNKNGLVELETLKKAIRPNTVLVSIMYVNNEVGTIQPIEAIGRFLKIKNAERQAKKLGRIYFHTDAAQALGYCDSRVEKLGVDLLSLSGHKIYAPKGVGAFYLKTGTPIEPLIFGGHQQNNIRPGTYPVPLIVALGEAVALIEKNKAKNQQIKKWRDYLIKEVKKQIPNVIVNGDLLKRTPNNANFIFKGVEGESIMLSLSNKGVAVSTGSACSSGSLEPSHVLTAMGIKPELAHGSLRVTLGRFNTRKDVEVFLRELPPIIKRLRRMSPIK